MNEQKRTACHIRVELHHRENRLTLAADAFTSSFDIHRFSARLAPDRRERVFVVFLYSLDSFYKPSNSGRRRIERTYGTPRTCNKTVLRRKTDREGEV